MKSKPKNFKKKIILYANTAWYLFNFRLALAKKLEQSGWVVILMAPSDQYVRRLEKEGFRVITVRMNRKSLNPLSELALIFKLIKIYRRESPSAVFNFTIKCVIYGSLAAKVIGTRRRINAIAGMGSVYTSSDIKIRLLRPFVNFLLRFSLSGAQSRVIVQNPDDAEVFSANRIVRDETLVLIRGSGVDGNRFRAANIARYEFGGSKKVLFASRLLRSKGIYHFIESARALKQLGNFEFLIAGDPDNGNPEAISPDELNSWLKDGLVKTLGHVDDMSVLLQTVDLVVLPSTYGEGVPRILVEAAASGLPLIAFDVPGSREIVLDKVNGYLVPPGDQAALDKAIANVFANREQWQQFGAASRGHFIRHFAQESVIARTLAVINATDTESGLGKKMSSKKELHRNNL